MTLKTFTNIQKLTYLKGQIMHEAQKLIDGFKFESSGYQPATDLLKGTHGHPATEDSSYNQHVQTSTSSL